ncbi:hypothetical protein RCL1_007544 [Eukaryota sp. TZLM3-RCL]
MTSTSAANPKSPKLPLLSVPCLFRAILLSFKSKENPSFHSSSIMTLFLHIYKIGNISVYFRSLIINLLNHSSLLENTQISSFRYSSQLEFLHKYCPNTNLSVHSTRTSKGRQFSVPYHLKIKALSLYHGFDISVNELYTLLLNFLNPNVIEHLELCCNDDLEMLWTNLGSTLSCLTSLSLSHSSRRVDFLCVSLCLSRLTVFKLSCWSLKSVDISNLINLLEFSIYPEDSSLIDVSGLSCLSKIKRIKLNNVSSCDLIHESAVLDDLVLEDVSIKVLETILTNQSNLINCKVSLKVEGLDIPASLKLAMNCNLIHLNFSTDFDDGMDWLFSPSRFPLLKSLSFTHSISDYYVLDLNNCDLLVDLTVSSNHSELACSLSFSISSPLFILKLVLFNLDGDAGIHIIQSCPFLHHLEVYACDFTKVQGVPSLSLDRLEHVYLIEVDGLLTLLPELPLLSSASFCFVDDMKFDVINSKFRQLYSLEVSSWQFVNDFKVPNCSISRLRLSTSPSHALFLNPQFLLSFQTIEHMCLRLPLEIASQNLEPCVIEFPSSLRSLHITGPLFALRDTLIVLNSIVVVSGELYVETDDLLDLAQEWLAEYTKCRPSCKFSLRVRRGSYK